MICMDNNGDDLSAVLLSTLLYSMSAGAYAHIMQPSRAGNFDVKLNELNNQLIKL